MEIASESTDMRARQEPLRRRFRREPDDAMVTDSAHTVPRQLDDPLHGSVVAGNTPEETPIRYGVHWAVGGLHDLPVPGDLLCAALGACAESTLRIVASRMAVPLAHVSCQVTAEVDVRGTLGVDPAVEVGFQRFTVRVDLQAPAAGPDVVRQLLAATERACVVLQTLRHGVHVEFVEGATQGSP